MKLSIKQRINRIMNNPPNEVIIKKVKHTPEYRIKKVMNWNLSKGINKESVVNVYFKIIKEKYQKPCK